MNELIAKLMKFLAQESQSDIEVAGEVEKTEGKPEDTNKSKVDEKATKGAEVKVESDKAKVGTEENSELVAVLKLLSDKLGSTDTKTEEPKAEKTEKTTNDDLVSVLKKLAEKVDVPDTKTSKTTQPKKEAEGFNPAEPKEVVVNDLAGAIALARNGNGQE